MVPFYSLGLKFKITFKLCQIILTTAALFSSYLQTLYLLTMVMVALLAGKGGKKKHFDDEGELFGLTPKCFFIFSYVSTLHFNWLIFPPAEKVPEITKVPDSPPSSPRSAIGELDEDTLAQNRLRLAQKLGSPNAKKKTAEKQYALDSCSI